MRVRELIAQLQAADPTGELFVFVHGDGRSPYGVSTYPHYYDGREFVIEPHKPAIGALEAGNKVVLHTTDLLTHAYDHGAIPLYAIGASEPSGRSVEALKDARAEVARTGSGPGERR